MIKINEESKRLVFEKLDKENFIHNGNLFYTELLQACFIYLSSIEPNMSMKDGFYAVYDITREYEQKLRTSTAEIFNSKRG